PQSFPLPPCGGGSGRGGREVNPGSHLRRSQRCLFGDIVRPVTPTPALPRQGGGGCWGWRVEGAASARGDRQPAEGRPARQGKGAGQGRGGGWRGAPFSASSGR